MKVIESISYEVVSKEKFLKIQVNENILNDEYEEIISIIGEVSNPLFSGENFSIHLKNGRQIIKRFANDFLKEYKIRDHRLKVSINEIKSLSKTYQTKDINYIYIPYKTEFIIFIISLIMQAFIKFDIKQIREYIVSHKDKTYCNLFLEYYKWCLDNYVNSVSNKLKQPNYSDALENKKIKKTILLKDNIHCSDFLRELVGSQFDEEVYIEKLVKKIKEMLNV